MSLTNWEMPLGAAWNRTVLHGPSLLMVSQQRTEQHPENCPERRGLQCFYPNSCMELGDGIVNVGEREDGPAGTCGNGVGALHTTARAAQSQVCLCRAVGRRCGQSPETEQIPS